jgi:hypothetical protein
MPSPGSLIAALALCGAALPAGADDFGAGPFRRGPQRAASCVCEQDQRYIARRIEQYRRETGKLAVRAQSTSPLPYAFVPIAGTLFDDVQPTNFIDLDPSGGARDFSCHDPAWTYDTHEGIDLAIRSFGAQDIGVPIFAAADGIVVDTSDGNPDRSTERTEKPANFVIIDHGGDVLGVYYHMKRDSVAVSVGDEVRAGQQIGLVGSSGLSDGPHLHFATYINGAGYEPFAGACRPGASGWVNQPDLQTSLDLWDVGVTAEDISTYPDWPEPLPVGGQLGIEDPAVYVWVQLQNLPAGSTHRLTFERPDGTTAYEYGPVSFGSAEFFPASWWWWYFSISDLQSITGTWHVSIEVDGIYLVRAPFEVRASRTLAVNRAPAAVTLTFDPPAPSSTEVLFCRVVSPTPDDVDYDLVRYTYIWTVNEVGVRTVTSAARSDAIPLGTLQGGDEVACSVTPGDGAESGPAATLSVEVAADETVSVEDSPVGPDDTNDSLGLDPDNSNDNVIVDNTNDNAPDGTANDNAPEDVRGDSAQPWVPPPAGSPRACGVGMIGLVGFWFAFVTGRRSLRS